MRRHRVGCELAAERQCCRSFTSESTSDAMELVPWRMYGVSSSMIAIGLSVCNYRENNLPATPPMRCLPAVVEHCTVVTSENVLPPRSAGRSKCSCALPLVVTSGLCRHPRYCRVGRSKAMLVRTMMVGKGTGHQLASIAARRPPPICHCNVLPLAISVPRGQTGHREWFLNGAARRQARR